MNDVYDTLPHRRENFRWVIDNTHDTLCFNCGRRDTCWKQEYAATLEGMEALRPLLEQNGGLETAQLPGQLSHFPRSISTPLYEIFVEPHTFSAR